MTKIFFILVMTGCSLLFTQTQFQRVIGGTGNDGANSIIRTTDGGYAVAGYTRSFGAGNNDFYIVKLDTSGTLQWSRTVGGTGNDEAYSIVQTTDGGYAVAGVWNLLAAGGGDMYIVKLDGSGTLQWSRTVGGTDYDIAFSIVQTTDGGYAVAGETLSFGAGGTDFYIVKLDGSGTLQWSKTVGGTGFDVAFSIIQTTDGGYAVAGQAGHMYIVKLDASGTLQWSRSVGGTSLDYASSIVQTTDGGYAVAGETRSFGAGGDMYVVKLNVSGTIQWTRTVGGSSNDYAWSIIQTTDGGYAVAGRAASFGAGFDFYIVKLNGNGTLQWTRTVGGSSDDYAWSIIQTTDGGYAVAGETRSFGAGNFDFYIVKLDASGNTCGNSTSPPSISGTGGTLAMPPPTVTTPPSTVTTPPSSTSTGGTLTTICTFVGIQPISNEIPRSYELYQNYPNPFNPMTFFKFQIPNEEFVKLVVFDVLGSEVAALVNEQLKPGTYEMKWDGSNFSSGIYFYSLTSGDYKDTKKMILVK